MSATNSGVTPESGFTYANSFLFYSRDSLRGSHGEVLASGQNSVMMDMNSFVWVSRQKLGRLGGAKFSLSATLPVANNSLTSDVQGALSGGGGFADSYYQPFILGWQMKRADIRALYGFLAPTGSFKADAVNNVGSGYWTHVAATGETFYLTQNKATALSAFQMYEFHSMQHSTGIHPGQTLSLDYSLTHIVALRNDSSLQLGLVGYAQWQTTDKSGVSHTSNDAALEFIHTYSKEAPIELSAYHYHENFFGGGNCIGGGGSGAARLSPTLQIVTEVEGCLVMNFPRSNQSGDSLFYGAGPRWTPLASHRLSPYAEFLFGGRKVTHEVTNDELRKKLLQEWSDGDGILSHYPKRNDWSVETVKNGVSIAAGGGFDVVLTRPFAWRVINLRYTHTWIGDVGMVRPQKGLRVSTEAVLRIGTW